MNLILNEDIFVDLHTAPFCLPAHQGSEATQIPCHEAEIKLFVKGANASTGVSYGWRAQMPGHLGGHLTMSIMFR